MVIRMMTIAMMRRMKNIVIAVIAWKIKEDTMTGKIMYTDLNMVTVTLKRRKEEMKTLTTSEKES